MILVFDKITYRGVFDVYIQVFHPTEIILNTSDFTRFL